MTKEVVTFEELGGAMTHTKKSGELFNSYTIHSNTVDNTLRQSYGESSPNVNPLYIGNVFKPTVHIAVINVFVHVLYIAVNVSCIISIDISALLGMIV